ncbi:MAG: glycosyltransferase family 2 protein, partial [Malacoplasma sp.]
MSIIVSIIMPSFNSEATIERSIKSVLSQTFNNWELIIIDDCSTDSSHEVIQHYVDQDIRIKLICLEENSGAAAARNTGIEHAKGQFIAFLDSDDYWHPEKLEKQLKYFEQYDVDVVFSEYYRFNSSGIIGKVSVPNQEINFNDLLKGNCIGNLTGIYNFKKHFEIRQRKVGAEDYLFWLEIFSKQNVKGIGIPEPLAYYRV